MLEKLIVMLKQVNIMFLLLIGTTFVLGYLFFTGMYDHESTKPSGEKLARLKNRPVKRNFRMSKKKGDSIFDMFK